VAPGSESGMVEADGHRNFFLFFENILFDKGFFTRYTESKKQFNQSFFVTIK
jgi:hypothetical protein